MSEITAQEWGIAEFTSYSPLTLDIFGKPIEQTHYLATCPTCGFISQDRMPLFCERCGTRMLNGKYYNNEGNEVNEDN